MTSRPDTFHCPSCGAPLELKKAVDNLVSCPYCGGSVIVPESLREPKPDTRTGLEELYKSVLSETPEQIAARRERAARLRTGRMELLRQERSKRSVSSCVGAWLGILLLLIVVGAGIFTWVTSQAAMDRASGIPAPGLVVTQVDAKSPRGFEAPKLTTLVAASPAPSFARVELAFGSKGSGPGQLQDSRWVAVDPQGNVYTVEYSDGRVQKFGPDGGFLTLWNLGKDQYAQDIAASRKGVVYVASRGEILKFAAADGKPLGKLAYAGDHSFGALALGADGSLVAVSRGETIVRFNADEKPDLTVPAAVSEQSGAAELDARVAVDGLGNIYLLGKFNNAVFVYSPQGKYINRFGSSGDAPGQLRAAEDIAVDGQGRIFVSDIWGVKVFSGDGRYMNSFKVEGAPFGLAVDDAGRVVVATNAPKIIRYMVGK